MSPRLASVRGYRRRVACIAWPVSQVVVVIILLLPMIWMYVNSFRTSLDLDNGSVIPHTFTLNNFRAVFAQGFLVAMRNSFIVAGVVSVVTTIVATLAAYGLARFRFRGRALVGLIILAGQAIPGLVILVPLIVALEKLHLTNTLVGLAIAYLPIGLPMSVYLLRSALEGLPTEVEDSAMCDGCNRVGVVRHVVLPLLRPSVIAAGAFTFTLCWGEYLFALSLLTSSSQKTLPLALQNIFSAATASFSAPIPIGELLAGGVVVSLPVALLFLAVQRHLIGGMLAGAIKG